MGQELLQMVHYSLNISLEFGLIRMMFLTGRVSSNVVALIVTTTMARQMRGIAGEVCSSRGTNQGTEVH